MLGDNQILDLKLCSLQCVQTHWTVSLVQESFLSFILFWESPMAVLRYYSRFLCSEIISISTQRIIRCWGSNCVLLHQDEYISFVLLLYYLWLQQFLKRVLIWDKLAYIFVLVYLGFEVWSKTIGSCFCSDYMQGPLQFKAQIRVDWVDCMQDKYLNIYIFHSIFWFWKTFLKKPSIQ